MVELTRHSIGSNVIGVFSSEKDAEEFMEDVYPDEGYSIYPLGTFLDTDMEE